MLRRCVGRVTTVTRRWRWKGVISTGTTSSTKTVSAAGRITMRDLFLQKPERVARLFVVDRRVARRTVERTTGSASRRRRRGTERVVRLRRSQADPFGAAKMSLLCWRLRVRRLSATYWARRGSRRGRCTFSWKEPWTDVLMIGRLETFSNSTIPIILQFALGPF